MTSRPNDRSIGLDIHRRSVAQGIEFLVSVVVRADNVVGCPVSSWGTLGTQGTGD